MSNTAIEDKKTVAMHESKSRDLQAKINALHNIEKVISTFTPVYVRLTNSCI